LRKGDLEYLKDFVKKAAAAQAAVEELLRSEGMNINDTYRPTGNARADGFKARIDALVDYLGREAGASGGVAQSMASTAAMRLNEAAYWASQAFTAEDFVPGDDGGARDAEPPTKEMFGSGSGDSDP
jgi:phage-related tail protein